MFGNIYGLDLGTYEIKVYDRKQDRIWTEKNVIAIEKKNHIFAMGDEAYEMYEKAPDNIEVVFPMKEGVISQFYNMQYLLRNLLSKEQSILRASKYYIAVPTDVTEVEKMAFYDLVVHSTAKAKEVRIVERGIADAIGLGLDVLNSPGLFIVNIGGETTELSVIATGGIVLNKLIKIGGVTFDQAITNKIRYQKDFLIGRITSEEIRKKMNVFESHPCTSMTVAGRDLVTGVPQQTTISISLVKSAIREPFATCVHEIKALLERTPPEVSRSIMETGLYLTGGLANLKGLADYIEEACGISVHIAPNPSTCAIRGIKEMIHSKELNKLTYSMLDDNYRWMR